MVERMAGFVLALAGELEQALGQKILGLAAVVVAGVGGGVMFKGLGGGGEVVVCEEHPGHVQLRQLPRDDPHFGTDRALRQGPWKLVSAKLGRWELYNLDEDRTETNDLCIQSASKRCV